MAEQEFPTVEESLAALSSHVWNLNMTLLPSAGIGVAAFPFEFTAAVQAVVQDMHTIAAAQAAQQGGAEVLGAAIRTALHDDLAGIKSAISPTLSHSVDVIGDVLKEQAVPSLADLSANLLGVRGTLGFIYQAIDRMDSHQWFILQYATQQFKHLMDKLQSAQVNIKTSTTLELGDAVKQLIDALKPLLGDALGPPGHFSPEWKPNIAHSIGGGQLAAGKAGWELPEGKELSADALRDRLTGYMSEQGAQGSEAIWKGILDVLHANVGEAGHVTSVTAESMTRMLLSVRDVLAPGGEARPDTAWDRCAAAYLFACALGSAAHGISALSDIQIAGCKLPALSGAAKFVGELAAFDPLGRLISGTMYETYCRSPLQYELHRSARPNLPSWGDALRWLSDRYVSSSGTLASGKRTPYTPRQVLEYHGLSDGWIDAHLAAMWHDLSIRELRQIVAGEEQTDDWWLSHLRELGYREEDIPSIRAAAESAACASERNKLMGELYDLRTQGLCSASTYRGRLQGLGLSEKRIGLLSDAADVDLQRRRLSATAEVLELQYDRAQITDDQYQGALDAVYDDTRLADLTFRLSKLRRYHKVWILTPAEQVREALPAYRAACIAGLISLPEYEAKLAMSGLEPDIVQLQSDLVDAERDKQQAAEFRSYGLPALRDRVVHGLLSLDDYAVELSDHGFPPEYIGDEVMLARAMLARRVQSAALSQLVPIYGIAYSRGLVSALTYDAVMQEGGLSTRARRERLDVADSVRREREDEKAAKLAREQEVARKAAEKERERKRKEQERKDEKAQRALAAAQAAREKEAAKAIATICSTVRVLLQSDDPAALAQVQGLLSRLDQAYVVAVGILPDDLYTISLEIGQELAAVGGPDPELLDTLVGSLEDRLTALAG